jgi:PPOX class probable F420-dependent enzyme
MTSVTQPTFDPHALLAESRLGVLATIKANGLPQLSPVTPFYDRDDGVSRGGEGRAADELAPRGRGVSRGGEGRAADELAPRAHGVLYVSMTEGRAKTTNLRRDPRAALEVTRADGWAWATAEGTVTLTGPGSDPHGPEVEALVEYYRRAAGEHPDWDEYRSVMVADRRVLMALAVQRVYGEALR